MQEVLLGYPHYRGLAIAHLCEAAAESMRDFPKLAEELRKHWKAYEQNDRYELPIYDLLRRVEVLLQKVRAEQGKRRRKRR